MAQYERHGLPLDSHELPDHLPPYLEYLTAQLPEDGSAWRPAGRRRRSSVRSAPCSSAKVAMRCRFELSLLKLANTQVDSQKVAEKIADEARDDMPQALDAVWEEEQVKFFADQGCGELENFRSPASFCLGAVAPQYLNIPNGGQQ